MKSIKRPSARAGSRLALEQLETRQLLSGIQPTAAEQQFLEQLNDARANPAAFGVQIGVDLRDVQPAQPLAFNLQILQAARQHAQDSSDRGFFGHVSPDGTDAGQRLDAAGVPWTSWGESLLAGSQHPTTADAVRALIVDAGVPDLSHRQHLLAVESLFRDQNQVGIGVVQGSAGPLSNYYAVATAATSDPRPQLLGVVFDDKNYNRRYEAGEGLAGVTITVHRGATTNDPVVAQVATWDSGGYAIPLDPMTTYTVVASGGALPQPLQQTLTVRLENARMNFPTNLQPVPNRAGGLNAWVQLLYQDVLGRPGTPEEIAAWTSRLLAGERADSVALAILASDENVRAQVADWYRHYLRREADAASLEAFTQRLRSAENPKAVLTDFLASMEYYAVNDATPEGFVRGLYRDLLGRLPVGSEAAGWIAQAAQGDRRGVITGVLASPEYNSRLLKEYYNVYLRRNPDAAGSVVFLNHLLAGGDERVVIDQILVSEEYSAAARATRWIQRLYQDRLHRPASAADLAGWLSIIRSGASPAQVATAIAGSAEAQTLDIERLYNRLLGRNADPVGQEALGRLLRAGGSLAEAAAGLAASQEYYDRHGGTHEGFVRGLYRDLLKRPASDADVNAWLTVLGSGLSRSEVALQIVRSQEYRELLVHDLAMQYLGRTPYTDEVTELARQLRQGSREYDLLGRILSSDEYIRLGMG